MTAKLSEVSLNDSIATQAREPCAHRHQPVISGVERAFEKGQIACGETRFGNDGGGHGKLGGERVLRQAVGDLFNDAVDL